MNMQKHLRRWLNDKTLRQMGDRYQGTILDVVEQLIRNPFTYQKQLEPVVLFEDGWSLVPNIGMRRCLTDWFGDESDDWRGRALVVVRSLVETADQDTGTKRRRYQKRVMLPQDELGAFGVLS